MMSWLLTVSASIFAGIMLWFIKKRLEKTSPKTSNIIFAIIVIIIPIVVFQQWKNSVRDSLHLESENSGSTKRPTRNLKQIAFIDIDAKEHAAASFDEAYKRKEILPTLILDSGSYVVEYLDSDTNMGNGVTRWWVQATLLTNDFQPVTGKEYDVNLFQPDDGGPSVIRGDLLVQNDSRLVFWIKDSDRSDNSGHVKLKVSKFTK